MSDGTEPTIVVVTPGAEGAGEGGAIGEVEGDSPAEAVADAAVEIAQIEADRDITLAVIHTENELAVMEQLAESHDNSELEQCRTRIAELEAENALLKTPTVLLIPEPLLEPPPSPEVVEVVEPESAAEDGPKESPAAEEKAPEPPPRKPKPHRWI